VAFKDLYPPVESAGTYAKRGIYAGQALALAKMGIEHTKDEQQAVAHVGNDRIKQDGMGMPTGRTLDPRHPNRAWAYFA